MTQLAINTLKLGGLVLLTVSVATIVGYHAIANLLARLFN